MQQRDELDDINFAENDTARETLRAVSYLSEQATRLLDSGSLTDDEYEVAHSAKNNLAELEDLLDERATRELVEDARIEEVADKLDFVHDLSFEVMKMLDDHASTIRRIGYPEPNPYKVADDSKAGADEHAEELRRLLDDSDDEGEAVCDGGIAIDDVDLSETYYADNASEDPSVLDSNGTKYIVGWDDHGWFNIQHVELFPDEREDAEYEYIAEPVGEFSITSFTPPGAKTLMSAIEKGL